MPKCSVSKLIATYHTKTDQKERERERETDKREREREREREMWGCMRSTQLTIFPVCGIQSNPLS